MSIEYADVYFTMTTDDQAYGRLLFRLTYQWGQSADRLHRIALKLLLTFSSIVTANVMRLITHSFIDKFEIRHWPLSRQDILAITADPYIVIVQNEKQTPHTQ